MNRGLLEKLADQMGVPYLSDLRMSCYWKKLADYLSSVHAEEYSPAEWKDAIQYLLGRTEESLRDENDARDFLIKRLKR